MAGIDWDSPTWGVAGHNVHHDTTGSWVVTTPDE